MRLIFIILTGLISLTVFSQTDTKLKTNYLLTSNEAIKLNMMFRRERKDFDFNGKVIAFTVGTTGTQIENKEIFFNKYINLKLNEDKNNICFLIILSKDEKSKSGGFDAVVISPVKLFTNRQREHLISKLSKLENHFITD